MYQARDILPFVMYCVYGESGSSLLIEYTDSMISEQTDIAFFFIFYRDISLLYCPALMMMIIQRLVFVFPCLFLMSNRVSILGIICSVTSVVVDDVGP